MTHAPPLRLAFCWIFAFCISAPELQAQQSSPAVPTIAYANDADGLRKLLNSMLLAAKREDPAKLQTMIGEMEIPNYQAWFTSNFGQEKGESWAEPYGRWLAKDEKEFQEFFVKLAQMEGEFITQSLDSAKTWGSVNGSLDAYRAKWRTRDAPKGEDAVHVGDFYFVGGKFRWFTPSWYDPFQTPTKRSIVPAKLVKKVQPDYPAEARENKTEGTVKLQVIVHKDGSVTVQNVVEGDPSLSPSAIEAVRQWHYEPTLLDGKPIDMETTVEVTFTLKP
jgi:TonB family protein